MPQAPRYTRAELQDFNDDANTQGWWHATEGYPTDYLFGHRSLIRTYQRGIRTGLKDIKAQEAGQ